MDTARETRLPYPLSQRAISTINSINQRGGRAFGYAIGGLPFRAADSTSTPFSVSTADMKKQQVDTEPEPGEHSLTGWWLRAQGSWHQGAGSKYQEITNQYGDSNASYRFYDSQNIDPWTKGELKLLNKLVDVAGSSGLRCVVTTGGGPILGGGDGFIALFNTDGTGWNKLTSFNTDVITDVAQVASSLYVGATDGKLDVYDNTSGTPVTKSLILDTTTTDGVVSAASNPRIILAKYRVWVAAGRFLYEIPIADISSKADGSSITAMWVNPDPRWTYTDVADGPSAVYFSGWSLNGESAIQKVVLDNSGSVPTLVNGVTTAIMPPGEQVWRIDTLGGSFIGIGSNRGFRVGEINSSGDISYGPLTVESTTKVPGAVDAKCFAVEARDRFFYVSLRDNNTDGRTYAVDLSQPNGDGTYAYARFVETGSGYVRDLTVCPDGRVAVAATDASEAPTLPMVQSVTDLCDTGWINFGYVRYRMLERKLFKKLNVVAEPLRGTLEADLLLADEGSTVAVATWDTQGAGELAEASVPVSVGARVQAALRLTLTADTSDVTRGPVVHGWWLKSLPAVRPQRVWQVPLECQDEEVWAGQVTGYQGWAAERLLALQAVEDTGDVVLFQDFTGGGVVVGRQVVIDKLQFVRTVPPPDRKQSGSGGVLVATLRTLD